MERGSRAVSDSKGKNIGSSSGPMARQPEGLRLALPEGPRVALDGERVTRFEGVPSLNLPQPGEAYTKSCEVGIMPRFPEVGGA